MEYKSLFVLSLYHLFIKSSVIHMKCFRIIITGNLMNAGIRFRAMEAAYKFGIKGLVRYQKDGSIYIEAEGEDEDLQHFVGWCKKGPIGAVIKYVDVVETEMKNFENFDIVKRHPGRRSSSK